MSQQKKMSSSIGDIYGLTKAQKKKLNRDSKGTRHNETPNQNNNQLMVF